MTSVFLSSTTGLRAQQARLDAVANNLANLSTTGYKATRVDLADLPPERLEVASAGDGTLEPTLIGRGVDIVGTSHAFVMGGLQLTDRPTDLAILGDDGFFQVQTPDGSLAYTRDGGFSVDGTGRLVTANGDPLDPPVQLPLGTAVTQITPEGVVMGTPPGATAPRELGQLQLARFANPNGLRAIGGNRFGATDASGLPETGQPGTDGFPRVGGGALEGSNVDIAEQATTMMEAQRAYSMNLRSVQTLDEMIGLAIQLRS